MNLHVAISLVYKALPVFLEALFYNALQLIDWHVGALNDKFSVPFWTLMLLTTPCAAAAAPGAW